MQNHFRNSLIRDYFTNTQKVDSSSEASDHSGGTAAWGSIDASQR